MSMKLSAAAAGVILLAGAVGAIAEDVITTVPQQETTIRQYVVKHPVEPLGAHSRGRHVGRLDLAGYGEGSPIEEPNVAYRYVVVDGRTVLVDPGTRKIVRIMK